MYLYYSMFDKANTHTFGPTDCSTGFRGKIESGVSGENSFGKGVHMRVKKLSPLPKKNNVERLATSLLITINNKMSSSRLFFFFAFYPARTSKYQKQKINIQEI